MAGITKEELLRLLNKDLGLEYTACVQYTQHQGVLKGAMYQNIQKELIKMLITNKEGKQVLLSGKNIKEKSYKIILSNFGKQIYKGENILCFFLWSCKLLI